MLEGSRASSTKVLYSSKYGAQAGGARSEDALAVCVFWLHTLDRAVK